MPRCFGPAPSGLPESTFSFIYETGKNETNDKGLPETSAWAAKLDCGARVREKDVVDTKAGYVYDSTRQDPAPMVGDACQGRERMRGATVRECVLYERCYHQK